jgi:hypothetical protein
VVVHANTSLVGFNFKSPRSSRTSSSSNSARRRFQKLTTIRLFVSEYMKTREATCPSVSVPFRAGILEDHAGEIVECAGIATGFPFLLNLIFFCAMICQRAAQSPYDTFSKPRIKKFDLYTWSMSRKRDWRLTIDIREASTKYNLAPQRAYPNRVGLRPRANAQGRVP